MNRSPIFRLAPLPLLIALGAWATTTNVEAQTGAIPAAVSCSAGQSDELGLRCIEAALASEALLVGFGRMVASGGAFPVSPSTAGWRVDGVPRLTFDAGAGFAGVRHPGLRDRESAGRAPSERTFLRAARLTVAAGIFDGFTAAPTVGGVASVDGVVTLRAVSPAWDSEFSGTTWSVGAGGRLGLFRESFSLPGVTLTGIHHWMGSVRYARSEEDRGTVSLEPRLTSLRLEAGKDMLALGMTGGVAWDRMRSRTRFSAVAPDGESGSSGAFDLRESRTSFFLGANYTWLVSQLAGEVAWTPASGGSSELQGPGLFRPGNSHLTMSLGWRITY